MNRLGPEIAPAANGASLPVGQRRPRPPGLITQLCRTANAVRAHIERVVLRDEALNWTSFDLLQLVCSMGPIETRTAVSELAIAKATLTGAADALSGRGLIHRRRTPRDRRVTVLEATATGRALVQQLAVSIRAEKASILSRADVGDGAEVSRALRAIAAQVRRPPPEGEP